MFSKVLTSFTRQPRSTTQAVTHLSKAAFSSNKADEKYAPWEESRILLTGC